LIIYTGYARVQEERPCRGVRLPYSVSLNVLILRDNWLQSNKRKSRALGN